jgi:phosphoribosyl 1,2-cyclic phosphate phosphodiesterase
VKFIVMGSGTSSGVPVIGCSCPVCVSADERDKRLRSSLYIKGERGERIVIDVGPDFRFQALRAGIRYLDFVLLTHSHADHVHGLDDLRQLSLIKPLRIYGNSESINDVRERFAYIWRKTQRGGGKPKIDLFTLENEFSFENLTITPIPVKHGSMNVLGWKIRENAPSETGKGFVEAAYITDCSFIGALSMSALKNISCLVLGALREARHETHFSFDEALETVKKIESPFLRQVFFTHISHEHSHAYICGHCAQWRKKNDMSQISVLPACDNLQIPLYPNNGPGRNR